MVQLQFLNKILDTKDADIISTNGITKDFFSEYGDEFEFIQEHIGAYGNVPDKETFFSKFPKFSNIKVEDSYEYLIKELYNDKNARTLASAFEQIKRDVMIGKVEDAVTHYLNINDQLVTSTPIKAVDYIEEAQNRYNDYLARIEDYGNYYIKTGFPELDNLIGGWDKHEELVTIAARTNQGKCLAKGTKILMADGSFRNVEDVKVGDEVQSYNRINTVLALHNGVSHGYKIKSSQGDEFTISDNHILTCYDVCTNSLVDMSIEVYNNLSVNQKESLYLFKPAVQYNERKFDIAPYELGMHWQELESIPHIYLTSSVNQRLELLAGIIDSDKMAFTKYDSKNECIILTRYSYDTERINNIVQLCLSVGLGCSTRVSNLYTTINIYGHLSELPIKENYGEVIDSAKNPQLTSFTVEEVPLVEYYGFMCDGDSRYMMSNFILTHNTWLLFKSAEVALAQGLRVGIYEGEMSTRKVGSRLDTMGAHISNSGIIRGDRSIQASYKQHIDSLSTKYPNGFLKILTPVQIGGLATVTTLRGFIDKYKLDILFIDQHSLMEDERKGKSPVEKASNISKDLKSLQVLKKIPIITVSQQNRTSTEGGVDTQHIAQSDRIAQDSTIIIFFEQNKEQTMLTMNLVKSRDSAHMKKLNYAFDFDKGIFTYIPEEQAGDNGEDAEAIQSMHEKYDVFDDETSPF